MFFKAESNGWNDLGLRISMNGISITVAPKERNFWESALAWWRARPTSIRVLPSGLVGALAGLLMVRLGGQEFPPTHSKTIQILFLCRVLGRASCGIRLRLLCLRHWPVMQLRSIVPRGCGSG